MKKATLLSGIIMSTTLLAGCTSRDLINAEIKTKSCTNQEEKYNSFEACDLELKDWYTPVIGDPEKSEKIILWWPGGPQPFNPFINLPNIEKMDENQQPRFIKAFFSVYNKLQENNISFVALNQSQWLKNEKLQPQNINKFTFEDAMNENLESVNQAHKIIKYFKDKKKKVVLGGESFGGYLVNLYLSKYGDDLPNHIYSVAARIDSPVRTAQANLWKARQEFSIARDIEFLGEDDRVIKKNNDPNFEYPREFHRSYRNFMMPLMGSLFKNYRNEIKDKDLSKTTFISAELDQHVGWLSKTEVDWAKNRKAQVDLYSRDDVEKALKSWQTKWGGNYDHGMGGNIRTFAHGVGAWNEEQFKKYYIDVFNK